jgi:ADP-glucose pyrophosphorylase
VKPRPPEPIGVSDVEVAEWATSTNHVETAFHNRRPLSTALVQKGSPSWSSLFVDGCVATAPVAESSICAPNATADKFAVVRRVVISTAELNAMRRIAITRTNR